MAAFGIGGLIGGVKLRRKIRGKDYTSAGNVSRKELREMYESGKLSPEDAAKYEKYGDYITKKERAEITGEASGGPKSQTMDYARLGSQVFNDDAYLNKNIAGPRGEDPALLRAQQQALNEYRRLYQQGGMDAQAREQMNMAQSQMGAQNAQNLAAYNQMIAAQGGGPGSGTALAMARANQANAANTAANYGFNVAADAGRRREGQLGASTNLATGMRGQDLNYQQYGTDIDKFNADMELKKKLAKQSGYFGAGGLTGDVYSSQSGAGATITGAGLNAAGEILGGYLSGPGKCWVARAIYGEDDPRWVYAREFIFNRWEGDLADAVRAFYIRHGEKIAKFINKHTWLKKMLKPLFDLAVERGK